VRTINTLITRVRAMSGQVAIIGPSRSRITVIAA